MTTWKKRLRPIAAIVALCTTVGLFGAVTANASNTTTTSATTGTVQQADGKITVKPADPSMTLKGQITSFYRIDTTMAKKILTEKGVETTSQPVSTVVKTASKDYDVMLALADKAATMTPAATFPGEGTASVPKGSYLAVGSYGALDVATTPGTVYMNGLIDTGELTSQDIANSKKLAPATPTVDTNATPSKATSTGSVRPAVLRAARTKVRMATDMQNDYHKNGLRANLDWDIGSQGMRHNAFWWGDAGTNNGYHAFCIDPNAAAPRVQGNTFYGYTIEPGSTIAAGSGPQQGAFTLNDNQYHAWQNIFYWGFLGPAGNGLMDTIKSRGANDEQARHYAAFATHIIAGQIIGHNESAPVSFDNWAAYQAGYNYLAGKITDNANGRALGMELIVLYPDGNTQKANDNRNLQGIQRMIAWNPHTYRVEVSTQMQTTGDGGKGSWLDGGINETNPALVNNGSDHYTNWVRDNVTLKALDGTKPNDTLKITVTLNADMNRDGTADRTVTKTMLAQDVIYQNGSHTYSSPAFTSMDLWSKPYWPQNTDFWFDATAESNYNSAAGHLINTCYMSTTGINQYVRHDGKGDRKESWFGRTTDLTVATEARYYDANGNGVSAAPTLNGSQSVLDHLMIKPTDQWVRSNETLTYTVTLNYDYDKNGTVDKSATKTKTESTYGGWATGQAHEADSDKFTAADLGLKDGWKPGDYWFDVTVSRSSVEAAPSLSKDSYAHEGKDDAKEKFEIQPHFQLNFLPSVSTKVTADTARDGNPVKDQVTVTMPANRTDLKVSGVTVKARGTLYWSRTEGTKGGNVPSDAKKVADLTPLTFTSDMLADGSETLAYNPATDPKVQAANAQNRLGTGHYTYVWRIDKNDLIGQTATVTWTVDSKPETQQYPMRTMLQYMNSTVSDGWQPDTEQTTMDATWTPAILKLGHVGQADGKWMDARPAANAILNMAETTDATGRTLAPTAQTSQIQLKQDGTGVFPTQVIGMGQTRYYKIWESRVGKPFNVPKNGAYWMVTAKQVPGTTGVQLTVTGSSDETRWLVRTWSGTDNGSSAGSGLKNNPVDWKVTLGDTLDANVTPPSTGGTADTLRMWTVIAVATGLAAAGALTAVTRRSAHAGRHSA